MIQLSLKDIARAAGGRLEGGDAAAVVDRVTADSRTAGPGSLFVALKGETHDGADFVDRALGAGAVAALTSEPGEGARIVVPEPQAALLAVGGLVRSSSKASVVAITGSNGKTLTKDLTAAAIGTQLKVVASQASFNNEIGVPLTLCSIEEDTEVLVAEVGARGPGHIASLAGALAPDVSAVLNIGEAHLGMFGDLETTARSKCELIEALGPTGTAVLNADDQRTRAMAGSAEQVLLFGTAEDADVRIEAVDLDASARAKVRISSAAGTCVLTLPLIGEHLASNAAAAIAMALALDLDIEKAARGMEQAPTSPGRTRLVEAGGRAILDDSYNANPASMRTALKTLAHLGASRPTWAVIGEMAELGDTTLEAHDAIGRLATRLGIDHLVAVGEVAQAVARGATLEGMLPQDVHAVAGAAEALELLASRAEPDAVILVKASRVSKLEVVVQGLTGEVGA